MKNILLTLMVFGSFGAFADCSSEYIKDRDYKKFSLCREIEAQKDADTRKQKELEREAWQMEALRNKLTKVCETYGYVPESIDACISQEINHRNALEELEKKFAWELSLIKQERQIVSSEIAHEEKADERGFIEKVLTDVIAGYPAAKLEAQKKQEAYNRGVRQGQAAQRARCNNQQGNC